MDWFYNLIRKPYIEAALIMDKWGRLNATNNQVGLNTLYIASMIRAAEVLARGLSEELKRGEVHLLQLTTEQGHLLVFSLMHSHYLILLTQRDAPIDEVVTEIQQELSISRPFALQALHKDVDLNLSLDDVTPEALIEAVEHWVNGEDEI